MKRLSAKPSGGETPKQKYWYKIFTEECVSCGYGWKDSWRERQYTPRPEDPAKRHEYRQYLCSSCNQ